MQLENWQLTTLIITLIYSAIGFVLGLYYSIRKKKAFGLTPYFYPLGIFVWGDATIFGLFWIGVSIYSWFKSDWILFLLFISVFWLIRSLGETIYWFNQQFTSLDRNPPHTLPGFKLVNDDSIWFIYQIIAQCISVISLITTIYLVAHWLQRIF
jgi:hypothetical protein